MKRILYFRAVTNVNIVVKHLNFFDLDHIEMDED